MIRLLTIAFGALSAMPLTVAVVPGTEAARSATLPATQAPPVTDVMRSGVLIVVSKASQRMFVFKDGQPWQSAPVSTGKPGHSTPEGVFPILQKAVRHRSNLYSNAPMPYMQRLTWGGIAIHAGALPGYPASHGCIRLPYAFARSLYALTQTSSTTVIVTNDAVPSHGHAAALALNEPLPEAGSPTIAYQPVRLAVAPAARVIPAKTPADSGGPAQTIQLAAAPSPQQAEVIWNDLVDAHPELAEYDKAIVPAIVGSQRYYRLRVTAPGASKFCSSLKAAGGDCFDVG